VTDAIELRWDGPVRGAGLVVLAHGAGAGMDHPWLAGVAAALAERGLRIARFEFAYMAARRSGRRPPPDRLPALLDRYRAAVAAAQALAPGLPLAVAGKSLGGRVATMVADELGALACLAFGYPFHPPKKPTQLRTAHLATLRTPTLILQGERDPFGTPPEVAGYALPPSIDVQWLCDGDHDLKPRRASGRSHADNLAKAVDRAARFVLGATVDGKPTN
jgi:hypothetical protein